MKSEEIEKQDKKNETTDRILRLLEQLNAQASEMMKPRNFLNEMVEPVILCDVSLVEVPKLRSDISEHLTAGWRFVGSPILIGEQVLLVYTKYEHPKITPETNLI